MTLGVEGSRTILWGDGSRKALGTAGSKWLQGCQKSHKWILLKMNMLLPSYTYWLTYHSREALHSYLQREKKKQHLYWLQTHSHQPVPHTTNSPALVLSTNTFTSTCPSYNKHTRLPHSPYGQTLLLFYWLVLQNVHSIRLTRGTKHTPHQADCTDNSYKICTPTSYLYWLSYENTHSTKLPILSELWKCTFHQVTSYETKCTPHQVTSNET